jgi:hypothetical protein
MRAFVTLVKHAAEDLGLDVLGLQVKSAPERNATMIVEGDRVLASVSDIEVYDVAGNPRAAAESLVSRAMRARK